MDALSTALPPAVANAMLSVWAMAVGQGEQVFAQRSEEMEKEAAAAARASSVEAVNAELQAEVHALHAQLDNQLPRLTEALTERAHAEAGRDSALRQAQAAIAERDAARLHSEQGAVHELQVAHARELEALRIAHREHETALRTEVNQATSRLEAVQKHVMLQTDEAREAQRRAEVGLSEMRQRN